MSTSKAGDSAKPLTVHELREKLNQLDVSPDAKTIALAIAWAFPASLTTFCKRHKVANRIHNANGLPFRDVVTAIDELLASGVFHASLTGKSISFHSQPTDCKTERSGRCVYCNQRSSKLTRDHVIPLSKGGPDIASNIALACRICNAAKRDRHPAEWARDILDYRKPPKPPITRLPIRYRLRIAIAATVSVLVSLLSTGGAK